MADPKTVAGGVAVVAIGGGAGYGISQAVDNKQESSPSTQPQVPSAPKKTIEQKIKEFGFELIKELTTDKDSSWTKVIEAFKKLTPSVTYTQTTLETRCNELLPKTYNEAEFKEAVNKCTKLTTFQERATYFGITLLSDDTKKTTRLNSLTGDKDFKKLIENTSTAVTVTNTATITDLTNYCTEANSFSFEKVKANKNSLEQEWKVFLKVCAEDTSKENVEYWSSKTAS